MKLETIISNEKIECVYVDFPITRKELRKRLSSVGRPYVLKTINAAIKRILRDYETEDAKRVAEGLPSCPIRPFTSHNLRHTFCTRFCENETNLKVIQSIMGHADIETTMNIYAEATEAKKQEVIASLEGKIFIR